MADYTVYLQCDDGEIESVFLQDIPDANMAKSLARNTTGFKNVIKIERWPISTTSQKYQIDIESSNLNEQV